MSEIPKYARHGMVMLDSLIAAKERAFTPAPKPQPRAKPDPRTNRIAKKVHAIPRLSQKREALLRSENSGLLPRSGITKKGKPIAKRNKKRQASEFARCYHSKARVEFVRSLACFATGIRGRSDNAHVTRDGSEGMGRKGGYRCIAPLTREAHRLWDTNPARFTERFGDYDGAKMAAWTEAQWQAHQAEAGPQSLNRSIVSRSAPMIGTDNE